QILSAYKKIFRDGSPVAIRSINVTCCIPEKVEFLKGLSLLTSLRHKNIVKMRGFVAQVVEWHSIYLDMEDGSENVLESSKRVSISKDNAKGFGYLHSNEASKPTIVHQNISVEKVLLDNQFNPLIWMLGSL
ncbi:hypothetical protein S245_070250, partial [Arachis hypogaea]